MYRKNFKHLSESETDETDDNNLDHEFSIINNHIYFYTDVSRISVLKLVNAIFTLETKLINMKNDYDLSEYPKIYIHIQSDGGDAYAGLSAMDAIRSCKIPIVTIVDGFVASAATFLLLGGEERRMNKNSHKDYQDDFIYCNE